MIRGPKPCRVVFDGQSRVRSPTGADPRVGNILGWSWPRLVMGMVGDGLPWYTPAVSGQSLTWLLDNFEGRADLVISTAEPTVYVLCGGYTDYLGEGNAAAQVYADAGALVDRARQAGAAYAVCTTTLPATSIAGAVEAERQAGNALVLADAAGYFDAVVDLEVSGLDDPADTGAYFDGIHIYGSAADLTHGTGRAAAVVAPVLDAAIAEVTS